MRYKFLVLIIFSMVSAQSLFNRFLGADSFSGSSRSTAMGKTHLLNSTGSHNVRFNPAMLSAKDNDKCHFWPNLIKRWIFLKIKNRSFYTPWPRTCCKVSEKSMNGFREICVTN